MQCLPTHKQSTNSSDQIVFPNWVWIYALILNKHFHELSFQFEEWKSCAWKLFYDKKILSSNLNKDFSDQQHRNKNFSERTTLRHLKRLLQQLEFLNFSQPFSILHLQFICSWGMCDCVWRTDAAILHNRLKPLPKRRRPKYLVGKQNRAVPNEKYFFFVSFVFGRVSFV